MLDLLCNAGSLGSGNRQWLKQSYIGVSRALGLPNDNNRLETRNVNGWLMDADIT